jgi:hypothetical protein
MVGILKTDVREFEPQGLFKESFLTKNGVIIKLK